MHSSGTVALLTTAAPAFGIGLKPEPGGGLRAMVSVPMADGSSRAYEVVMGVEGGRVSAREGANGRLPAFCPIRHINIDGSFCLNWEGAESLDIRDADRAETWWAVLHQFIRLQERAGRLRRWPDRRQWAHGGAARHQRDAQIAASALSPRFQADLARGRITATRSKANSGEGRPLRLIVDGRRVLSVFDGWGRPATLRQACPCGRDPVPTTLRRCRDHRHQFVALARALRDQETAEAAFWKSWRGRPCCGTMDECPLASNNHGEAR